MPTRIDAELERIEKLGQNPKVIYVGNDLYFEIYREINPVYAAPLVWEGEEAPVYPTNDVTDYKGIKVVLAENEEPNYLHIET